MTNYLFTSESVTEGHPDKVCDAVSDAILDAMLEQDPYSRVACECCACTDMMAIMGEVTSSARVDIERIARDTVSDIGYNSPGCGFDADSMKVVLALNKQSPDIALGVDRSMESKTGLDNSSFTTGAGDQGMMFGYACDETKELMPMPISLAHALTRRLSQVRKNGEGTLRPDGKGQVTVEYAGGRPVRIDAIVLSAQHVPEISRNDLVELLMENVIKQVIPAELMDKRTRILINPTGRFVVGGPHGDTGLTGRKIIVDTYGGYARHGGGCFSGKDPTKVDRSAAYAARYAAKNIVAAGLAAKCEIQLAYAIGVAQPVSVLVDTFGTGKVEDVTLSELVSKSFDLRPEAIINTLGLRRPIYRRLSAYGHMGRSDLSLAWERIDRAKQLLSALS